MRQIQIQIQIQMQMQMQMQMNLQVQRRACAGGTWSARARPPRSPTAADRTLVAVSTRAGRRTWHGAFESATALKSAEGGTPYRQTHLSSGSLAVAAWRYTFAARGHQ